MKLPLLIASDLHLTADPTDEYRWGLFPWLIKEAAEEGAKTIILEGDITDQKDYHSATLVNRAVAAVKSLRSGTVERVIVLMGNHDRMKDGHMYFEFLRMLEGVEVITKPTECFGDGAAAFFLPYTKQPHIDWKGMDFSHYQYLFMHQTFKGAVSESGRMLEGMEIPPLNAGKVFSGDVHVPQILGPIEYVGAPYHVHYGDKFKPRCIVIDKNHRQFDLHYPTINRVMLDVGGLDELSAQTDLLRIGDQVKVRISLDERDKHLWRVIRQEAEQMMRDGGLLLAGLELIVKRERKRVVIGQKALALSPAQLVYEFVDRDALGGELLDVGLECLE